jgi:casein kinase 1
MYSIVDSTAKTGPHAAPSRRDDLESLGYMALYFLHGSLPWQGLKAPSRQEKYRLVFERKKTIPVAELCHDLPAEFATYMSYIREMDDQEKPDYNYLRGLFGGLFRRKGFEHDNVFDWTIREFERLSNVDHQHLRSGSTELESKTKRPPVDIRDRRKRNGDTKES